MSVSPLGPTSLHFGRRLSKAQRRAGLRVVDGRALGEIHILRQVGSTIVFYSWIPEGAQDARAPGIQAALETLGLGIAIPG